MSARRLHVPRARLGASGVALLPEERHYLVDVLRLAPGDALELFDGEGGLHDAVVGPTGEALLVGPRREAPAPAARVWLAFALSKGEKNDLVVQKATELGVERLLPLAAARSVVKLDAARAEERTRRWRRIAEEAARQCGRADLPEVAPPATLAHLLASVPAGARLVAFDAAGGPLADALDPAAPLHLAITGPEGGLAPEELRACVNAGARLARLGPRVLRAETAAVAVVALLQHRLGDLG